MIISRKKFNQEIENAVNKAIEECRKQQSIIDMERRTDERFDRIGDWFRKEIDALRDKIDDLSDAVFKDVSELRCKIEHKKKQTLNEYKNPVDKKHIED